MRRNDGVPSRSLSLLVTLGPLPSSLDDALHENAVLRTELATAAGPALLRRGSVLAPPQGG